MCGRYQLVNPRLLAQVYGVQQRRLDELQLASNVNVRPTQRVPVLLGEHDGGRDLAMMRWGFVPSWAKDNRGADDQRAGRGPRREADVPQGVQVAALRHPGDRLLRVEGGAPTAAGARRRTSSPSRTPSSSPSPASGTPGRSCRPARSHDRRRTSWWRRSTTACRSSCGARTWTSGSTAICATSGAWRRCSSPIPPRRWPRRRRMRRICAREALLNVRMLGYTTMGSSQ